MQDNIIEIKNLCKSFQHHPVLSDINLTVKRSEFLTLLGPSGCGKTTLLRLLSGFETPDSGEIYIAGQNMANVVANQRHVNTVFQSYALFPHMTVFENVAFGLRCQKIPREQINERVMQSLEKVHLKNFAKRKPSQLSGGQQQRVAIARAVVNEPYVLLLDEPMSALDYRLRKKMQIELKALQRELGITFILVTHDQEEALSMADRVAVMEHGVITQLGTPREVYEEPANISVANFIGEANFLETQILEATPDKLKVAIEGKVIELPNPRNINKQQEVVTLVRPEDLKVWGLTEVDATDKMYFAEVQEVIYKGSTVGLIVKLDSGTELLASEFFDEDDAVLEYKIGEQVWVEWYPGWEVVLVNQELEDEEDDEE
jgi:spermidine/putrescine transport system ATP-binding protein